jgi:hypothetical protein
VSREQFETLQAEICSKIGQCWATQFHTDGGVTANAGAPWQLLLLDYHFSTCASPSEGGHCDLAGVWPQAGNEIVRLIEIKAGPERSQNLQRKFDKSGRLALAVLSVGCELQLELHVPSMPKNTTRYQFAPKVSGRRYPVKLVADGHEV